MTIEYQISRSVMSKVLPTPPASNQTCSNALPEGFTGVSLMKTSSLFSTHEVAKLMKLLFSVVTVHSGWIAENSCDRGCSEGVHQDPLD